MEIKSVAKVHINITEPRLHPGLRNSLEHQLLLITSSYLGHLTVKSSNLSSGLQRSWLTWRVVCLRKTMDKHVGRQTGRIYCYLIAFC